MSTSYPGAIDALTNPSPTDALNSATVPHAQQHANANDAIEAIEATLGVNPQGSAATVVARLTALDSTVAGKETPAGAQAKADAAQSAAVATAAADATSKASTAQSNATSTAAADATSKVATHAAVTTNVHGIANTANLVVTSDSRLSDTRTPTDGSVTTAKIADSAVTSAKIADGTIVNADISTTAAIAPSKIDGTAVITTDSRLSDARTPTDGSVTTAKIVDGAVTSAKIADGTIVNADISGTAAIAASKVSGTAVTQVDTGTVSTAMIADNAITTAKIAAGAVITADIADGAVTSAKIADGTIVTADLSDGAVSVAKTVAPVVNTSAGVGAVYFCDNPASGTGSALTIDTANKRATWIINHNIGRYPLTIQIVAAGGVPIAITGYSYTAGRALTNAVTSVSRTASSATVRVSSVAHGLSVGDTFSLTGTINVGAAGVFTVSNVVSADQFEYVSGGTSTFNSTAGLQVFRNLGTYATVQFGTSASSFSANNFRAVLIG